MTDYSRKLAAWLGCPVKNGLVTPGPSEGHDIRADWLAASADRPQWPSETDAMSRSGTPADFAKVTQLVHPLSGARWALPKPLVAADASATKSASQEHFDSLVVDGIAHQTFLNFWRFGPELHRLNDQIGAWWQVQPADHRMPDHSIWNHCDLVSAIHTALAGDDDGPDQPALLAMSFGPVQGFIAQARSTPDLWAGSHLLSSLVWEALRSVVESLGPDCVVFPALRGVPAVDRWLVEQDKANSGHAGMRARFESMGAAFLALRDDTNPLFAASLPNKFVAIVPQRQAQKLAEKAVEAVHSAVRLWAEDAAQRVFDRVDRPFNDVVRGQLNVQLAGFPEAAWASVCWPTPSVEQFHDGAQLAAAAELLKAALGQIHPDLMGEGVFKAEPWKVLSKQLQLGTARLWSPGTGLLYAPVFELVERVLASAKAVKDFKPLKQEGHRCTLTGEAEWLTDDRGLLDLNRKDRARRSVWGQVVGKFGIKAGEHLCAIATLKRLWPTLFAEQVGKFLNLADAERVRRYVVSTHAMALSTTLEKLAQGMTAEELKALNELAPDAAKHYPVTLPLRLRPTLRTAELTRTQKDTLRSLPAMLDADDAPDDAPMDRRLRTLFGTSRPETYYALIQMDGDRMGGWLAGSDAEYRLRYRDALDANTVAACEGLMSKVPGLGPLLEQLRPSSPGRHVAISQALNEFSTLLARYVVEDCCKGKLLYAGGDDVLALVSVDDLFDCMQMLRLAYSGIAPDSTIGLHAHMAGFDSLQAESGPRLLMGNGFAYLRDREGNKGRLMTLMGHKATASMGALVAHHTAPLGMVLRQLRAAEGTAKGAGRDAFCLRVLKRGGGEVSVVSPWWETAPDNKLQPHEQRLRPLTEHSGVMLMRKFAQALAGTAFSRGAIYRAQLWFEGLTDGPLTPAWQAQVTGTLAYQFERQSGSADLANEIVDFVCKVVKSEKPLSAINDWMVTSEFFAREARSFRLKAQAGREQRQPAGEPA